VKKSVKTAVSFIGEFEKAIVHYALQDQVDGVVCGHIHSPIIRMIGHTAYYNSGDWVESLSALVEDFDGKIELLIHRPTSSIPASPQLVGEAGENPLPVTEPLSTAAGA